MINDSGEQLGLAIVGVIPTLFVGIPQQNRCGGRSYRDSDRVSARSV